MTHLLPKLEVAQNLFREFGSVFVCPICQKSLTLHQNSLCCSNNHQFDLSKKGCVRLLKKERALKDDFYNSALFSHRRSFILAGFYKELHKKITTLLTNQKAKLVLDLGCGEGSHFQSILKKLKNCYVIGCDLAPDGVQMATDYLRDNYLPLISDVYHLPFKEGSFDAVVDILSPFMYQEVLRVLKPNGIFIKVTPTNAYLKELRQVYALNKYEKEEDVLNNLKKHFSHITQEKVEVTYPLTPQNYEDLIYMTPLMHYQKKKVLNPIDTITISLNIYIFHRENQ